MVKEFIFLLFLTSTISVGFESPAIALEKEQSKTNQVVSKNIYKIIFPKDCPVSKGKMGYISLCTALFHQQKKKPLPALLPLFMVFGEDLTKQKIPSSSKTDIKHDAARMICGSEQELSKMIIGKQSLNKSELVVEQKLTVICPADKYGVIGQRKGHYLQITTKSHRYHAFGRFLKSQSNSLDSVTQSFIDSFQLTASNLQTHLKEQ